MGDQQASANQDEAMKQSYELAPLGYLEVRLPVYRYTDALRINNSNYEDILAEALNQMTVLPKFIKSFQHGLKTKRACKV